MKKLLFLLAFLSAQSCFAQIKPVSGCKNCIPIIPNAPIRLDTITVTVRNPGGNGQIANANGIFSFTLNQATNTSAGVYNVSGNLVRELWSVVPYSAGSWSAQWDGLLDDGTQAPLGVYTIKLLCANNAKYEISGGIGNTGNFTQNIFGGFSGINTVCATNSTVYWGENFSEGGSSADYFSLSDQKNNYKINVGVQARVMASCTDGVNVYYAARDDYNNQQFIYAVKVSDNTAVQFSSGVSVTTGQGNSVFNYAVGRIAGRDRLTTYNAISVNANYIFVSSKSDNKVYVFNKNTGSLLQTLAFNSVSALTCTKDNASIWIAGSNSVTKYTINSDASLTLVGNQIACSKNVGLGISPTTNELAVADSATEQVKFYNQTGVLNSTFGQLGGYVSNGPLVTYDKFMFCETRDDQRLIAQPVISFQPDGSFWLNDGGNYRCLHFNADKTYKEQFAYVPACRSVNVDPNNISRVFADTKEYYRDYTKDINATGAWSLKYNWSVGVGLDVYAQYLSVTTFPNGKTYGWGGYYLYELNPATGPVLAGVLSGNYRIEADGSLRERRVVGSNYHIEVYRKNLTGYSNGMPQWTDGIFQASTPTASNTIYQGGNNNTYGASTNTGKVFFFNPGVSHYDGLNYHLAAVPLAGSDYTWKASKGTFANYQGDYPRNGYMVQVTVCRAMDTIVLTVRFGLMVQTFTGMHKVNFGEHLPQKRLNQTLQLISMKLVCR